VMLTVLQGELFIVFNNYLQDIHTAQCMSGFLWTRRFTAGFHHNKLTKIAAII
jgi:hypothetical protein